jgi:hypothetical protein
VVLLAAIATIVTAIVRLKMLNRALEDTTPKERPEIIRALRGLWKSEWQVGPLRRGGPRQRRGGEPARRAGDATEPP